MGWFTVHFKSFTFNFTQVKNKKGRYASQSELYILKKIILTQKCYCEVSIVIAINQLFKLAVFGIQHLNLNRDWRALCIYFFLCIKLQERLIKIQLAHNSKCYLKFWHAPDLSHSGHQGINSPPKKHSPPSFLQSTQQIVQAPLFKQLPLYIVFLWPRSLP